MTKFLTTFLTKFLTKFLTTFLTKFLTKFSTIDIQDKRTTEKHPASPCEQKSQLIL